MVQSVIPPMQAYMILYVLVPILSLFWYIAKIRASRTCDNHGVSGREVSTEILFALLLTSGLPLNFYGLSTSFPRV